MNTRITHADAAFATQFSLRSLRHVLGTGHVRLSADSARQAGQWRRLAPVDAVRLAVLGALLRYGCTTDEAAEITGTALTRVLGSLEAARGLPLAAIVARLSGLFLHVHMGRGRMAIPGRMNLTITAGPPAELHGHGVTLDLGAVASGVAERLAELDELRRVRPGVPVVT